MRYYYRISNFYSSGSYGSLTSYDIWDRLTNNIIAKFYDMDTALDYIDIKNKSP